MWVAGSPHFILLSRKRAFLTPIILKHQFFKSRTPLFGSPLLNRILALYYSSARSPRHTGLVTLPCLCLPCFLYLFSYEFLIRHYCALTQQFKKYKLVYRELAFLSPSPSPLAPFPSGNRCYSPLRILPDRLTPSQAHRALFSYPTF